MKAHSKRNRYNGLAVEALSVKYEVTKQFIRQCLRKERESITADAIRKDYKKLTIENEQKINQYLKK